TGREFVNVFPQDGDPGSDVQREVTIAAASSAGSTAVTVLVYNTSFRQELSLAGGQIRTLSLPAQVDMPGSYSPNAFLVQADQEVSVLALRCRPGSCAASPLYPVGFWGNHYYAMAPLVPGQASLAEIVITNHASDNLVDIVLAGPVSFQGRAYSRGDVLTLHLGPFWSAQLQSPQSLSGSEITSQKAVGVVCGYTCAPEGGQGCSYGFVQLLPTSGWGDTYVVPPLPTQSSSSSSSSSDLLYVFTYLTTQLRVQDNQAQHERTLLGGAVEELPVNPSSAAYITASRGVQVVYFRSGAAGPFLMGLLSADRSCLGFGLVARPGFQTHAVVVARGSSGIQLRYDGVPLPPGVSWHSVAGVDQSWGLLPIGSPGQHSLQQLDGQFGVYVIGTSPTSSYSYPGLCSGTARDPCQVVRCGYSRQCVVKAGVPVCVSTAGLCQAWGDPHYLTFDGTAFDFQGGCTYTISQTSCRGAPPLPSGFAVQATNENRGDARVSFVRKVHVTLPGVNITIVRGEEPQVRVNGSKHYLPIRLQAGALALYHSGFSAVLETAGGLLLRFDWLHHLQLELRRGLLGAVCGLCGNFNDDPSDDLLTPDGRRALGEEDFGRSWAVAGSAGGNGGCRHDCGGGPCPRCSTEQLSRFGSGSSCGLLEDPLGPFAPCRSAVDPAPYIRGCVYELCVFEGGSELLCRALKTYADACQWAGIQVSSWRGLAHCPLTCPVNSHYEPCGSACPATCSDPDAPAQCQAACVEMCQCDVGFLLSGGGCVLPKQCGCTYQGFYYLPGQQFWADNRCQELCTCDPSAHQVRCVPAQCQPDELCHSVGGELGCHPVQLGVCSVEGDPHYTTFDGRRYDFEGSCVYQLAASCPGSLGLEPFEVRIQNEQGGPMGAASSKTVLILVHGYQIEITREHKSRVLVNGILIDLPSLLSGGEVKVYRRGLAATVETDFGFILTYDWNNHVTLAVNRTYSGFLCGLCGNYNDNPADDLATSSGQLTSDPTAFGRSWRTSQVPGCQDTRPQGQPACGEAQRAALLGRSSCGMLTDALGPFRECHRAVDPDRFFQNCLSDVCLSQGRQAVLCQFLASYVGQCQEAGANIYHWRSSGFCAVKLSAWCEKEQLVQFPHQEAPGSCCVESEACSVFLLKFSLSSQVDGVTWTIPAVLDWVSAVQHGLQVRVETRAGLVLLYDLQYFLLVSLPGSYGGQVCGLCGDFNGSPEDDLRLPDGRLTSDPQELGAAWTVPALGASCLKGCGEVCPRCDPGAASQFGSERSCGMIAAPGGPFAACVPVVDPQPFLSSCVYDLCVSEGSLAQLCRSLEAYAATCQDAGVDILPWRSPELCSWHCPENSHYEPCGSACPATCSDPEAPARCQAACVETCQCDVGFLLSGGECVAPSQCGCTHDGFYYPANETFWADEECHEQCTCDPHTSRVTCRQASCGLLETCQLVGGVRRCQPLGVKSCSSEGGLHFVTFDGLSYDFQGGCVYQLVGLCSGDPSLTPFTVWIQRGRGVSPAVMLTVNVYGITMEIGANSDGRIQVDGLFKSLPYFMHADKVVTYSTGLYVVVRTAFGLSLTLDSTSHVALAVPSVYSGTLCGLCGNYNANSTDDLTGQDGQLAESTDGFGRSWRVGGDPDCADGCKGGVCLGCPELQKELYMGGDSCAMLTDPSGPFRECHSTVDAHRSFNNCVGEVCSSGGLQSVLCQSLARYVSACQEAGVHISPWRNSTFCDLLCPAGSHYSLCSDAVPPSCVSVPPPVPALSSSPCREDCQCDPGLLRSGGACVPPQQCGCFHDGGYLLSGETYYTDFCQQLCTCQLGGVLQCQAASCSSGEECRVKDGVLGSLRCPEFSHYSLCADACAAACAEARPALDCPANCTEACACDSGYVFDGNACVSADQCGCLQDGRRYKPGEDTLVESCSLNCTCVPPSLLCEPYSCPEPLTCQAWDGVLSCHEPGPCTAKCHSTEICVMRNGVPVCEGPAPASCWAWGDPHYHSFDGWDFDFQGTCTYILAASNGSASGLEPFTVTEKNENRGNAAVSFLRVVHVAAYGHTLSLHRRESGKVRVNGAIANLPISLLGGKLTVRMLGTSAVLATDFGLRVLYNWDAFLLVSLPGSYRRHVGGLCGNFNGDPGDDQPALAGAESWRVSDGDPHCCTRCQADCQACGQEEEALYSNDSHCGAITEAAGIFSACHATVDPRPFFRGCLHDLCQHGGARPILCQALDAYGMACGHVGAVSVDWSAQAGCSSPCPEHSSYTTCGTACPRSCTHKLQNMMCIMLCVAGCFCDKGYLQSPLGCVREDQCGCIYNGQYYNPGEVFWTPVDCRQRCTCVPSTGVVRCQNSSCGAQEQCSLNVGVWGCHPTGHFNCTVQAGRHFLTFDRRAYDFRGSCSYWLVRICSWNSQLVPFEIRLSEGSCGNRLYNDMDLSIKVYKTLISISKASPLKVQVNGSQVFLPFSWNSQVVIYPSPWSVMVETDFGLRVVLYQSGTWLVFLPSTYGSVVCGLCGNANGNPSDDFLMPTGQLAASAQEFGSSWQMDRVPGCETVCSSGTRQCSVEEQQLFRRELYCGVLLNDMGPFGQCTRILDPQPYLRSCIADTCAYGGHHSALCSSIAAYVAACQAAEIPVRQWRRDTFCGAVCPDNSHYELCGTSCPVTCYELAAPVYCSAPCREGCQCNSGFVLSNGRCIPISECGCLYQGQYYPQGVFYPEAGCHLRCQCSMGGRVQCFRCGCGPQEQCQEEGGVRKCVPASYGMCLVLAGIGYVTFDGDQYVAGGSCSYLVAQAERSGLEHFAVVLRMEGARVASVVAVALERYNIMIRRAAPRKIRVNGEDFTLPLEIPDGLIWAYQDGITTVLQTGFGLKVLFSSNGPLWLVVPSRYRSATSGLCGNFNGLYSDDRRLRSGAPASSLAAFLSSWAEEGEGAACDHGCADHCPFCDVALGLGDIIQQKCGLLSTVDGPFGRCRAVLESAQFFPFCVDALCKTSGDLCLILEAYAMACRSRGGVPGPWRANASCPLTCPDRSSVSPCVASSSSSCSEVLSPPRGPGGCSEGCQCNNGNVFDGGECIPLGNCGCLYQGRYIKMGAKLYNEDCTRRCECHRLGGTLCEPTACSPREICALRDGVRGCHPREQGCQLLGGVTCSAGEQCVMSGGFPSCVQQPVKTGTCSAMGDPHYRTFDGRTFDFMGTCTYIITKNCRSDDGLPAFEVEAKNENRGSMSVSYVAMVTVKVYGYTITVVRVNYRIGYVPMILDNGKVTISQSGRSVTINTDFGLTVQYDWEHYLVVTVPGSLAGKLCGLCGNFNGRQDDDFATPSGSQAPDAVALGRSWRASGAAGDGLCWDDCNGQCRRCEHSFIKRWEGELFCGLLTSIVDGPFRLCHSVIDPKIYLDNCVFDVCMADGYHHYLCRMLEVYTEVCQRAGIVVYDWRTLAKCPARCPENSHYELCGSACPATCSSPDAPSKCSAPCVETCACNPGFVLSRGRCVPQARCGCTYEGRHIPAGETVWADDSCRKRCYCNPASSKVECREEGCRSGEQCQVVDGVRGCYPVTYSTCTAAGDPHYLTFDGHHYNFQGTCVYQLVGVCSKNPSLVPFEVLVQNNFRGNRVVSYTKLVEVKVYGMSIIISREFQGLIEVNNELTNLPAFLDGGKVVVYRSGWFAVVKTNFGLQVAFDWNSVVTVTLPSTYAGAVCGLCGNYNNKQQDDLQMQNGRLASSASEFGQSWRVVDIPGCVHGCKGACPDCDVNQKQQYETDKFCGLLRDPKGPFRDCHAKVDPSGYFQDCVYDVCLYKGSKTVLCQAITSYTAACQEKGAKVYPWRSEKFCDAKCPANSHYEVCASGCPATCYSLAPPAGCQALCKEGCACNDGFILSGDQCVPLAGCGCLYSSRYYKTGEVFYPDGKCQSECRCQPDGRVECAKFSCGPHEECKLEDGVRKCHAVGEGTCSASGDPHYVSFDGKRFDFQGTCTYTLAKACGLEGTHLAPFSVDVENEKWGNGKVAVTKLVAVEIDGNTLILRAGVKGQIMVNGVWNNLPISLNNHAVRAFQHGINVIIDTSFGLRVTYDLVYHVTVRVPGSYRDKMCGLCGNFNGNQKDDFLLPSGQLTPDIKAFGSAWKVAVPGVLCDDACSGNTCPVCEAKRQAVFEKRGYCGILTEPNGPFAQCYAKVHPDVYFSNCIYDLCMSEGDIKVLCNSIAAYVTACQSIGVDIKSWRTPSFCPLSCAANSHYEICADSCSVACAGLSDITKCPTTCAEGCACDAGFFFDGEGCVPMDQCGCYDHGRYYKPGEVVYEDECQQKCTCNAIDGLVCEAHSCPAGTKCLIRNGIKACFNTDPCKDANCRVKETCRVEKGQAVCVPQYTGTCWAWGDPHYHTFDGYNYDFQGTCTYIISKTCGKNAAGLVPFSIEEQNDNRGSTVVSYVREVVVFVYGYKVTMLKQQYGRVMVNDELVNLPVIIDGGQLNVYQSGIMAVLQTDFGLTVSYDWNWHLVIQLPSSYYDSVCGLCGNFNGNGNDEMRTPDGKAVSSVIDWAKAWRVQDKQDAFCWDSCQKDCPTCDGNVVKLYETEAYCGALTKKVDGLFQQCHVKVDPRAFMDSCVYDMCQNQGDKKMLCQALTSYANMCRREGIILKDWRKQTGCPMNCQPLSHYEPCASPCPVSCPYPDSRPTCNGTCVETCECDPGFVLSAGKCVLASTCGCSYQGRHYQPYERFWPDEGCHKLCECDPTLRMVVCKEASCKASEECSLVDGVRGCHPLTYSTCTAAGDPHYYSFDGHDFTFQGTCIYQFVGLCSKDPSLVPFKVNVQNNHRGSRTVAYTKVVAIEVFNLTIVISIDYPNKVLVNGELISLPFYYDDNKVVMYKSGAWAVVQTDFGMKVQFDWSNVVTVTLPSTYKGAVCGLCGNYNNNPADDSKMPDGRSAPNVQTFGDSWKVGEVPGCSSDCSGPWCKVCSDSQKDVYRAERYCGAIVNKNGPFRQCHARIDPARFMESCVYDACHYKGRPSVVCDAVTAYAAACQDARVPIQPWRSSSFCPATCPRNSHYELCATGCPATCHGLSEPSPAATCPRNSHYELCATGCPATCHGLSEPAYGGRYYKKCEVFYPKGHCNEQCKCGENGAVSCTKFSCGAQEECKVVDGVRGCHPVGEGSCVAYGDPHYVSFDGHRFNFQGTCTYTLAKSCDSSGQLVGFAVEQENVKYGNQNVAVTMTVAVIVYDYVIAMSEGMRWFVFVNDVRYNLPLSLDGGKITVNQRGGNIVVRTDFGLQVFYDSMFYVRVTVPSTYRGKMCGLCGNYNSDGKDDLLLPSGAPATSVDAFGKAWRVGMGGVAGQCGEGCGDRCHVCERAKEAIYGQEDACGLIKSARGPFQACHSQVDPELYFQQCVFDVCALNGDKGTLCKTIQAYVAACQLAGADVKPWRTKTFCPATCPANSHYELCADTCSSACASLVSRAPCSSRCFEGCECDQGFMADGDRCVSAEACGCVYDGAYLQVGQSVVTKGCSQKCTCQPTGGVVCEKMQCASGEQCSVREGVRGCHKQEGSCTVKPGAHLKSFDAMEGKIASGGAFEIAALCDRGSVEWFRVVVDVRLCVKGSLAAAVTVYAFFDDTVIAVNNEHQTWVNGKQVALPQKLKNELSIHISDKLVIIEKKSAVRVSYSVTEEVTVAVSAHLAGRTCGACGNFNGDGKDDMVTAGGKISVSVSEIIDSWRAKDFSGW
ncbi:FCGBP protein, partial [Atractosteus spatula]|nr:FCGBP protein [Atractosteus spatula]